MTKKNDKGYHYTDSGLDYVYLANGYNVFKDPEFGEVFSIHNLEGLNKVIAKTIVTRLPAIRGQELRFLRSLLKLNQTELGRLLGRDVRTIQRWEEKRNDAIDITADKFLRLFYAAHADGKKMAHMVCEYLKAAQEKVPAKLKNTANSQIYPNVELSDTHSGWKAAA